MRKQRKKGTTLLEPAAHDLATVKRHITEALALADALGVVVTIRTIPKIPLAMGNFAYDIELRPGRLEVDPL